MKKFNWKKALSITGNVVFYVFIVCILLFAVSNLKTKKHDDIPTLFGRGYVTVLTDSMSPTFDKGDLIVVKVLNEEAKKKLNEGDIITFWDFNLENPYAKDAGGALNTHRIVSIDRTNWQFQTKGDNPDAEVDQDWRDLEQVKAVYVGRVKNVGSVIAYLQSSQGMLIFIVVPTILFLGYELFLFVRVLLKANSEKVEAKLLADKERIRQELLEELKKEQNGQAEEPQK